jgi:hypothetical protein
MTSTGQQYLWGKYLQWIRLRVSESSGYILRWPPFPKEPH